MKSTQAELTKKVACSCLALPCVHNPELSEDVAITVTINGQTTPKGVKYVYLEKDKYLIVEETDSIIKMQVLK